MFWYELRLSGKPPERRGYHSTFEHNQKLYIFGGHDIREGSMDSLWSMDLSVLSDLEAHESGQKKNCQWEALEPKGKQKPGKLKWVNGLGPLAHHSSCVYGGKMYLFGGSNLETENKDFFVLDLATLEWKVIASQVSLDGSYSVQGVVPVTRDEHAAAVWGNKMIIFGGFVMG